MASLLTDKPARQVSSIWDLPPVRLDSVHVNGFRSLTCEIALGDPLAVVVGANNAGKTALLDALRTVLVPREGPRAGRWIVENDFAHDGKGGEPVDRFEIELRFSGLDDADEARMATCLSPSLGDGWARVRLTARRTAAKRVETQLFGGDSNVPEIERFAREAVQYVYLPALRDAERDLRPGRDNQIAALLVALATSDDQTAVTDIVEAANTRIDIEVGAMRVGKGAVQQRLRAMSGPMLSQLSRIAFSPARFEAIVRLLTAYAGDLAALDLEQNGLGYNNLLYMATLLAAMEARRDALLQILLIEEPEAHLHPQLQDLAEPDPLRAITTLVAAWAAAFALDPDGVPRGGALGAERMARRLADALPAEHPLHDALWAFLRPMLSPRLAELHRDAFVAAGEPTSTVDLDGRRAETDLDSLELGDRTANAA